MNFKKSYSKSKCLKNIYKNPNNIISKLLYIRLFLIKNVLIYNDGNDQFLLLIKKDYCYKYNYKQYFLFNYIFCIKFHFSHIYYFFIAFNII